MTFLPQYAEEFNKVGIKLHLLLHEGAVACRKIVYLYL